jgi:hypothetical protein
VGFPAGAFVSADCSAWYDVAPEGSVMDTEGVRAEYRPQCIETLFVGESPPASGKFFYYKNTALARAMKATIGSVDRFLSLQALSGLPEQARKFGP